MTTAITLATLAVAIVWAAVNLRGMLRDSEDH